MLSKHIPYDETPERLRAPLSISELAAALEGSQKRYEAAYERQQAASREATTALNELNNSQKQFTEAVNKLQAEAPHSSDWGRSKHAKYDNVAD